MNPLCYICANYVVGMAVVIANSDNAYNNEKAIITEISDMLTPNGHAILTVKLVDKLIKFVIEGHYVRKVKL